MKKVLLASVAGLGLMASGATAATLKGEFWDVAPGTIATIDEAITAVSGGADPTTATFTSTSVAYGDGPGWGIGSLSDFLNADAGSIVGTDSASIQESVFRLKGKIKLEDGDKIDVTSDDGFRLIIGGSTFTEFLGLRAPNNTTSGTWSGGSGIFDVTLWYFEGNVTQAQLVSNLGDFDGQVPLPATGWMMLAGLGGIAAMRRRKKA